MTRALVTGASGGLGRTLVRRLEDAGVDVLRVSLPEGRPPAKNEVHGDLLALPWPELLAGREVAFHLAARVHVAAAGPEDDREHQRVNAEGTAAVARGCREAGATLVFVSTVSVLGRGANGLGDDAEPRPDNAYGRSKWAAEEAIRAEGRVGLRYAILRFPLLYGPGGRGNMERMLTAIRRGRYWPVGDQSTRKSCLAFDDAARALLLAAERPQAHGRTWIAAPPSPVTLGEIHAAAWRAAGRRGPPPALPGGLARLAATAADTLLRLAGRPPRLAQAVSALTAPAWYDGGGFARATGFAPAVSLGEGLVATAAWLAQAGGPGWTR